ncbi:hypothetical protein EV363DRAFT_1174664 [Boletus edulis]|nr:hypothetical protein EV363DRAFT_1174664 [Boletus edulis]
MFIHYVLGSAAHNELMTGEQVTTYSEDGEIHERDERPYIQRNGNENGMYINKYLRWHNASDRNETRI